MNAPSNFKKKNSNYSRKNASAMYEQLRKFKQTNKLNSKRPLALSTAITDWKADGEDHINVNTAGNTSIGQFLAHDSYFGFVHPKFGRFASSRSFWLWLKTQERDDRLRDRTGVMANNIFRNCTHRQVPNARAIMLDADYNKLKQYPDALEAFKNSELPLDTYYFTRTEDGSFPRRPSTFFWLVEGWEEIRNALKEDREPDFSKWLDVQGSGIYDYVFNNEGHSPSILNSNRQRSVYPARANKAKRQKSSANAVVDISDQNKTVDLDKQAALKAQVHTVDLVPEENETAVNITSSDVTTIELVSVQEDSTNAEPVVNSDEVQAEPITGDALTEAIRMEFNRLHETASSDEASEQKAEDTAKDSE